MSEKLKKGWLFLGTLLLVGMLGISGVDAYITNQATLATNPAANALFVPVRNADAVAHEVGDVVVWSDNTNDGVDITTTSTAHAALVAGVVAIKDIPGGAFGLVQVAGYHAGVSIAVANVAGDALVTSTTAEETGVFATATSSATLSANIFSVFAIAFETTITSTTVKAIIRAI